MSEMVWEKDGSGVTAQGETKDGQYGGRVVESTYTFTPQASDNGVDVSCTPKWKENKFTELRKTVILDVLCEY